VTPQYLLEHYDDVASAVNNGETVEVSLPEKPRFGSFLRSPGKLRNKQVLASLGVAQPTCVFCWITGMKLIGIGGSRSRRNLGRMTRAEVPARQSHVDMDSL
jgi:hypothetical protein